MDTQGHFNSLAAEITAVKDRVQNFRDGDLVIVNPDVVRAAIEVKTRIRPADLQSVIEKIDATAKLLRRQPKSS
jgi:hypothetical protein